MGKIVRFDGQGRARYGRLGEDGAVEVLSAAPWLGGRPTGETLPLGGLTLLAPCEPSKIVCVGKNFAAHAREMGGDVSKEPIIFLKPPSSVIGTGAAIVRPRASTTVHHEAELGVVIGHRCRRVTAAYARGFGAGMTCVNDVTARDIQAAEKQFTRSKGFDTFCPLGPWIEEGPVDTRNLTITCRVNGQVRQQGNSDDMVVDPWQLVAFISTVMTLEPGDVVTTGTPAGVGPLMAGDTVEVEITGIGILRNTVVDEV